MIFNLEFLKELQNRLNGSDSYRMTKYSVKSLLKSKILEEDNKKIIFSSLIHDISNNNDPLSLAVFWNTNINNPELKFKF